MTLKGSLETLPLTAILQFVSEKGDSGSVRIDDGTDEWFIYFENGRIRLLTRGKEENYRLGSYLQKFMFVTRDVINECLRKASASGTRPETALMQAKLATEDHLCAAVHVWTEDTLFELTDLKKGEFEVMKDYHPRAKMDRLVKSCEIEIPVSEFLLELARRECEWVTLIEDIPDDNVILEATDFGPDDLGSCMLPISWLSQTDLVDGTRTVAEILEETILSRFELYKFVADLKRRGLILVADRDKLLANAEEALKRNDIGAAQKFFENVLSSHGEDLPLRIRYANILKNNNVTEKAFEQFCEIGKYHFKKNENEEAAEYYLKAQILRPESVIVRSLIADMHERLGDMPRALEIRAEMAYLHRKSGKHRYAASIFVYLSEVEPDEINWCFETAESFGAAGMPETAVEFYEKAINIVFEQGRGSDAHEILEHAKKCFPGNQYVEQKILEAVSETRNRINSHR